jgi:hypothetical protein
VNFASGTNLQLKATCNFGGKYYLLAGTNIAQPLTGWKPAQTNSIINRGTNNYSVTITNVMNSNPGRQFYILQSP